MKKKITIEEILNGLPENNLFIDVELKSVKNNISLLNRIYSEGLLSKLLDEYFAYRKKTTNYYKRIEFLQTINNYTSLLEGNDFSGNFININDGGFVGDRRSKKSSIKSPKIPKFRSFIKVRKRHRARVQSDFETKILTWTIISFLISALRSCIAAILLLKSGIIFNFK